MIELIRQYFYSICAILLVTTPSFAYAASHASKQLLSHPLPTQAGRLCQGECQMSMPQVELNTNKGRIVIELNQEKAPKTVENFLRYVREGFYNGVIFHRVIDGFMVQGGGFDENFKEKSTHDSIENEADNGLKNDIGTIAMARTSAPHSASAQFFINVANNNFLNHSGKTPQGWGYAVFGQVVEGMDVVNQIKTVRTGSRGGHQDVPLENIVIESARIINE